MDIVSTSVAYTGLGFMKDGGFYQMLRVSSVVFCALLSIPVLKQKLGWYNWTGIFIIIAGITLKSVPSIQDFLSADEAEVDGCVGVQELSKSAMMMNLTAAESGAAMSQACDKTCQTLIGILLIIVSEVIFEHCKNLIKSSFQKFFVACQNVYEEKYISKYDLHPLMVVGYEGTVQNFIMYKFNI